MLIINPKNDISDKLLYIYIYIYIWLYLGVSLNGGTWKVKIIENRPIQMDDLEGKPTILGNPHIYIYIPWDSNHH